MDKEVKNVKCLEDRRTETKCYQNVNLLRVICFEQYDSPPGLSPTFQLASVTMLLVEPYLAGNMV